MKPVKFKYQNITFGEGQDEYLPLPALKLEGREGHVISCWKLNLRERLILLFTGRIWVSLMTFKKPLQPTFLTVKRKEAFVVNDDFLTLKTRIKNILNPKFKDINNV